jgi:hypothetical protein
MTFLQWFDLLQSVFSSFLLFLQRVKVSRLLSIHPYTGSLKPGESQDGSWVRSLLMWSTGLWCIRGSDLVIWAVCPTVTLKRVCCSAPDEKNSDDYNEET